MDCSGVVKIVTAAKRLANIKKYHAAGKVSSVGYQIKEAIKEEHIKLVCSVDTREKYPWTEEEIGIPTVKNTLNVGDYQFAAFIEQGEDYKVSRVELGLVIERKGGNGREGGPQDLYGTLMSKNWDRFCREIDRFHEDKSLNLFAIFAECNEDDFMTYVIPSKRRFATSEFKRTESQRRGKLASLTGRGAHVLFKGSRFNCVRDVRPLVIQWICKNYKTVFGFKE